MRIPGPPKMVAIAPSLVVGAEISLRPLCAPFINQGTWLIMNPNDGQNRRRPVNMAAVLHRYMMIRIQIKKMILTSQLSKLAAMGNIGNDADAPIDVIQEKYAEQLLQSLLHPDLAPQELKIRNLPVVKLLLVNLTPGFNSGAHVFVGFNHYQILIVSIT